MNNLNPIAAARSTEIRMSAFSVALSSPFPTIEIPIERNADGTVARKVTLVPFAKSDWGCLGLDGSTAALDGTGFRPTNQIVDFYVESISDQDGDAATCVSSGKCPKYVFRINYEDVEQGADHDMDAIVKYTVELINDNGTAKVQVNLSSDYAAGCIHHHMGYVISGTTDDGIYLDVRDRDTTAANDRDYFLDTPDATNLPYPRNAATYKDGAALPLSKTRLFVASTQADQSAILLKDPLWYAAKYGGFKDINSNGVLDGNEWDTNGDGIPDSSSSSAARWTRSSTTPAPSPRWRRIRPPCRKAARSTRLASPRWDGAASSTRSRSIRTVLWALHAGRRTSC